MRPLAACHGLIGLGLALAAACCSAPSAAPTGPADVTPSPAQTPSIDDERTRALEDQLRAIAREYTGYARVSSHLNWSPQMCRTPGPPTARMSAAPDGSPHGRKLYTLYARDRDAYLAMSFRWLFERPTAPGAPSSEPIINPVGQVVVKQAFTPEPADELRARYDAWQGRSCNADEAAQWRDVESCALGDDGHLYRAGPLAALFVMLKLEPGTPGTDNGWVYATIGPDLTTITSMGAIESCVQCHRQTDRDRLYGDRNSWPERWPGARDTKR